MTFKEAKEICKTKKPHVRVNGCDRLFTIGLFHVPVSLKTLKEYFEFADEMEKEVIEDYDPRNYDREKQHFFLKIT